MKHILYDKIHQFYHNQYISYNGLFEFNLNFTEKKSLFKTEMRVFAGNHNIIETTSVFILYCVCFQVFIISCIPMFYNIAGIAAIHDIIVNSIIKNLDGLVMTSDHHEKIELIARTSIEVVLSERW